MNIVIFFFDYLERLSIPTVIIIYDKQADHMADIQKCSHLVCVLYEYLRS
jgi:hypothetical protein